MTTNHESARSGITAMLAPLAAGMLALLAAAGCQQSPDASGYVGKQPIGGEIFTNRDEDARIVNRVATVQASNAANKDATLRPYHFEGPELNSLGQQKLDLIVRAERGDMPLTVFLDIPQDPDQGTRREAVLVFLRDHGLRDEQIRIEAGPNLDPDNMHPTAQGIRIMHLLDAGAPVAQNPEPAGALPLSPGVTPSSYSSSTGQSSPTSAAPPAGMSASSAAAH